MPAGLRGLRRTTHHHRQCDVLVPLGVSRLLQDLAAELGDTKDWSMELHVESKLCGNYITQKPSSATLAALRAGSENPRSQDHVESAQMQGVSAETRLNRR